MLQLHKFGQWATPVITTMIVSVGRKGRWNFHIFGSPKRKNLPPPDSPWKVCHKEFITEAAVGDSSTRLHIPDVIRIEMCSLAIVHCSNATTPPSEGATSFEGHFGRVTPRQFYCFFDVTSDLWSWIHSPYSKSLVWATDPRVNLFPFGIALSFHISRFSPNNALSKTYQCFSSVSFSPFIFMRHGFASQWITKTKKKHYASHSTLASSYLLSSHCPDPNQLVIFPFFAPLFCCPLAAKTKW